LIISKEHPDDGRYKQIFLTDTGKKLVEDTQQFAVVVEDQVKQGMTAAEFETSRMAGISSCSRGYFGFGRNTSFLREFA